ncbi:MAG: hypothetical protein MRQ13_04330 [Candidatus Midichloria sp.]|nr:hypothetical protein [Candidatus Midichloria sp.]
MEREFESIVSLNYPLNEMNSTSVQKFAGKTINLLINKTFDWVNWNLPTKPSRIPLSQKLAKVL